MAVTRSGVVDTCEEQATPSDADSDASSSPGLGATASTGPVHLPTLSTVPGLVGAVAMGLFGPLGLAGIALAAGAARVAQTSGASALRGKRTGERLVAMVDSDVLEAVRRAAFEQRCSISHVVTSILRLSLLPATAQPKSDAAVRP